MKQLTILIAVLVVAFSRMGIAYGEASPPPIYSGTGVVIDSSTGEVLYQKNKDEQAFPASLTKLMTAILLEEHMSDGEWMTASKKAVEQEASNFVFNLKLGEKMQKEEALKALLVISANDVAMMIAEHIGGDEAGFAEMMNQKAAEIGMTHTHFVTPNGLHDPKHYTTAYDLALLAKEAMKYPDVMNALETETTLVHTDQRQVTIKDRTSLIFQNPLALGGKTGFTDQAHNTLLEYLKQDNKTVIAVVMKSSREKEYPDVEAVGKYGLDRIEVQRELQKGDPAGKTSFYGMDVQGVLGDSFVLTQVKGETDDYSYTPVFTQLPDGIDSIEAGDVIGSYQIKKNGELLAQIPIVAAQQVVHTEPQAIVKPDTSRNLSAATLWLGAGAMLVLYGSHRIIKKRKLRKPV